MKHKVAISVLIIVAALILAVVLVAPFVLKAIFRVEPTGNEWPDNDDGFIDYDTRRIIITDKNWTFFKWKVKSSELSEDSLCPQKINLLTKDIAFSGCKTSSIRYTEHGRPDDLTENDWSFVVYWIDKNDNETVGESLSAANVVSELMYVSEGVDVQLATNGYTLEDAENDIYQRTTSEFNSYVCIINEKMYMRVKIRVDMEDYDTVLQKLIDHVIEIKEIANS